MKRLNHVINALPPVADAFSGAAVYSDIINMKNYNHIQFIVQRGAASGAGTATITAEACDDVSASNVSAVPFAYQACVSGDTFGAITKATNAGFLAASGANGMFKIDVDAEALLASGYSYIRLKSAEVGDFTYVGSILAILTEGRYEQDIPDTVLV
jgi:hypothetical protein